MVHAGAAVDAVVVVLELDLELLLVVEEAFDVVDEAAGVTDNPLFLLYPLLVQAAVTVTCVLAEFPV